MRLRIPRRLARAPIPIYQRRLGWLLGSRFLMLEHVGRRSGCPRQVVLEVVEYRDSEVWRVSAAYGDSAQWYRNVVANPEVRVWWRRQYGVPARATVSDRSAARETYANYVGRHPRAARAVASLASDASRGLDDQALVDHLVEQVPLVVVTVRPSAP